MLDNLISSKKFLRGKFGEENNSQIQERTASCSCQMIFLFLFTTSVLVRSIGIRFDLERFKRSISNGTLNPLRDRVAYLFPSHIHGEHCLEIARIARHVALLFEPHHRASLRTRIVGDVQNLGENKLFSSKCGVITMTIFSPRFCKTCTWHSWLFSSKCGVITMTIFSPRFCNTCTWLFSSKCGVITIDRTLSSQRSTFQ